MGRGRRFALKFIEKYLETSASFIDSYAIPLARKRQENYVRMLYRKANEARRLANLPPKTFKRISSKGLIEEIT